MHNANASALDVKPASATVGRVIVTAGAAKTATAASMLMMTIMLMMTMVGVTAALQGAQQAQVGVARLL
jgi:hypothetical protein